MQGAALDIVLRHPGHDLRLELIQADGPTVGIHDALAPPAEGEPAGGTRSQPVFDAHRFARRATVACPDTRPDDDGSAFTLRIELGELKLDIGKDGARESAFSQVRRDVP